VNEAKVLVGDIGGTHARFAIARRANGEWEIAHRSDIETEALKFADVLHDYLGGIGNSDKPDAASIAVAGPVTNGRVSFTNRNWQLSEDEFKRIGFSHALLINDFAALAFAAAAAPPHKLATIGPELKGLPEEPISILGAGTGFGVSCLARYRGRSVPIATEGGHMGFAPGNDREIAILTILAKKFGHVSVERVLSGPGIENIHAALSDMSGRKVKPLEASVIVDAARAGEAIATETLKIFCGVYGSVAGDFALAHGARGGVFIAGGIAQKIQDLIANSDFRARFEAKGRLSYFVKPIPTRLILDDNATFIGAAIAAEEFRDDK